MGRLVNRPVPSISVNFQYYQSGRELGLVQTFKWEFIAEFRCSTSRIIGVYRCSLCLHSGVHNNFICYSYVMCSYDRRREIGTYVLTSLYWSLRTTLYFVGFGFSWCLSSFLSVLASMKQMTAAICTCLPTAHFYVFF